MMWYHYNAILASLLYLKFNSHRVEQNERYDLAKAGESCVAYRQFFFNSTEVGVEVSSPGVLQGGEGLLCPFLFWKHKEVVFAIFFPPTDFFHYAHKLIKLFPPFFRLITIKRWFPSYFRVVNPQLKLVFCVFRMFFLLRCFFFIFSHEMMKIFENEKKRKREGREWDRRLFSRKRGSDNFSCIRIQFTSTSSHKCGEVSFLRVFLDIANAR